MLTVLFLLFLVIPHSVQGTAWLRLPQQPQKMLLAPGGKYLAFTSHPKDQDVESLHVLNVENRKIWNVGNLGVHASLQWSPDGYRLFYRTLKRQGQKVESHLWAWDPILGKSIQLESFSHRTGLLSLEPHSWRLFLPYRTGVHTRKLRIQGLEPSLDDFQGAYVVTQRGMLWVSAQQKTRYLFEKKKKSGLIQSFDVCPQGHSVAWSTYTDEIYLSRNGREPKQVGWGVDPKWNDDGSMLVFAGSRRVGVKTQQYDLRVIRLDGKGQWLTKTPEINERWPQWESQSSLLHSVEKSTDVHRVGLPSSRFFSARPQASVGNM